VSGRWAAALRPTATSKADQAALATLAARRLDEAERKRLRGLVAAAKAAPDSPPEAPPVAPNAAERLEALKALRLWYEDWAEVAHALFKRRDHLIRLGLARRKMKKKDKGGACGEK
jgi:hypothetical protein